MSYPYYVRKTRDVWDIETNWGYGWEVETSEVTYQDAREQLRCYQRESFGRYQVRMKRRREHIS